MALALAKAGANVVLVQVCAFNVLQRLSCR